MGERYFVMTALCLLLSTFFISFATIAVLHRRCLRLVGRIEMRDYIILRQYEQIDRLHSRLASANAQLAARTTTNAVNPLEEYIDTLDLG